MYLIAYSLEDNFIIIILEGPIALELIVDACKNLLETLHLH
jgi:hypothetical protein